MARFRRIRLHGKPPVGERQDALTKFAIASTSRSRLCADQSSTHMSSTRSGAPLTATQPDPSRPVERGSEATLGLIRDLGDDRPLRADIVALDARLRRERQQCQVRGITPSPPSTVDGEQLRFVASHRNVQRGDQRRFVSLGVVIDARDLADWPISRAGRLPASPSASRNSRR